MNGFLNKKINHRIKNWLLPAKYTEMRSKNAVRNQYTNLYAYAANNPVHYIDPDGRKVDTVSIKLDLSFSELENLAISWQKQYEKGGILQNLFSAFGIAGNVSSGTQDLLKTIGKTLSTTGEAAFKVIDKTVFFVGLIELVMPDNVKEPKDAVHSFYFSLLEKKKDDNYEILKITSTVITTKDKHIVNHKEGILGTTTEIEVLLQAEVYDKRNNKTETVKNRYILKDFDWEF